jgi:hypothetical protein
MHLKYTYATTFQIYVRTSIHVLRILLFNTYTLHILCAVPYTLQSIVQKYDYYVLATLSRDLQYLPPIWRNGHPPPPPTHLFKNLVQQKRRGGGGGGGGGG